MMLNKDIIQICRKLLLGAMLTLLFGCAETDDLSSDEAELENVENTTIQGQDTVEEQDTIENSTCGLCTLDMQHSLEIIVQDNQGNVIENEDLVVEYRTAEEWEECLFDYQYGLNRNGIFKCGWEDLSLSIRARTLQYVSEIYYFELEEDPCHVLTEQFTIVLEKTAN